MGLIKYQRGLSSALEEYRVGIPFSPYDRQKENMKRELDLLGKQR